MPHTCCSFEIRLTNNNTVNQANIMVSSDEAALIADFGNAQLKDLTLKFTSTTKAGLSVRWAV